MALVYPKDCLRKAILKLMGDMALQVEEFGQRGIRCMAVARTDADGQWHMLGLLTFLDPPRPDTRATLETALHYGVQARMVSLCHGSTLTCPAPDERSVKVFVCVSDVACKSMSHMPADQFLLTATCVAVVLLVDL